jgi:DNA-binding NarL/FixJ family response regulator
MPHQPHPASPGEPEGSERLLLRLLALGCTTSQIASQLNLSREAVDTRRAEVMASFGLSRRVDVVRYAQEHGLT